MMSFETFEEMIEQLEKIKKEGEGMFHFPEALLMIAYEIRYLQAEMKELEDKNNTARNCVESEITKNIREAKERRERGEYLWHDPAKKVKE
jgi:hypothetical protein